MIDFNLFKKGTTVAVALSGGKDSMCLLSLLLEHKSRLQIKVVAINVEHGIRGEESLKDTEFVENYCFAHNVSCKTFHVDAIKHSSENGFSLEQSARILRYECFFEAIKEKFCDVVATAHHRSDNVETILFNLFRGSGLKGSSGISSTDYDGKIIRPLIYTDKNDIVKYVKENSIPFVEDSTNSNDAYTRNFLRLNVIPLIKKVFPEAEKSLERFALSAKEDDTYLTELAQSLLKEDRGAVLLPLIKEKSIFSRAVILALKNCGVKKDYEKNHVDDVYKLIDSEVSSSVSLPKNVKATREYDGISIYKEETKPDTSYPFGEGIFEFLHCTVTVKKTELPTKDQLVSGFYLDKNKIPSSAEIRFRRDGDVFTKFGGGTKKLNDFFTDKKIIGRNRDFIPLVADGNTVYLIADIAVSDKSKIDDTSYVLQIICTYK